MDDLLEGLPEKEEILEGEIVDLVKRDVNEINSADSRREILREIEDELLNKSLAVVEESLDFHQIDPAMPKQMPEIWKDLPKDERTRKFRIAQYALMPMKEAPAGMNMALKLGVSIIKARAVEKAGPRDININAIEIVAPQNYPEKELGDRE